MNEEIDDQSNARQGHRYLLLKEADDECHRRDLLSTRPTETSGTLEDYPSRHLQKIAEE